MNIPNKEFLESLGPGGFPGEAEYIIELNPNVLFSPVSGLVTIDIDKFDWNSVPTLYKDLSVEWGGKTWIPNVFNEPEIGAVFLELAGSKPVWIATPSKLGNEGKFISDTSRTKIFTQTEYLDAVAYVTGE